MSEKRIGIASQWSSESAFDFLGMFINVLEARLQISRYQLRDSCRSPGQRTSNWSLVVEHDSDKS